MSLHSKTLPKTNSKFAPKNGENSHTNFFFQGSIFMWGPGLPIIGKMVGAPWDGAVPSCS